MKLFSNERAIIVEHPPPFRLQRPRSFFTEHSLIKKIIKRRGGIDLK